MVSVDGNCRGRLPSVERGDLRSLPSCSNERYRAVDKNEFGFRKIVGGIHTAAYYGLILNLARQNARSSDIEHSVHTALGLSSRNHRTVTVCSLYRVCCKPQLYIQMIFFLCGSNHVLYGASEVVYIFGSERYCCLGTPTR